MRLFVDLPLAEGLRLSLPDSAARHVQVLRLQPGDPLALFNAGRGGAEREWPASVVAIGRREVEVLVGAPRPVDRELPWPVTLALGAPANERMDWLVEKAGELGAASLQPLLVERSVLRLSGPRAEARRLRWQAIAAAASEQCGRARVTRLEPIVTLAAWLDAATTAADGDTDADANANANRTVCRLVLSLAPEATPLTSQHLPPLATPIVVLSGPEGGLTAAEEQLAVEHGFIAVSLGQRVLRSDTAPLALLAWLGIEAQLSRAPSRPPG